MLRLLHHPAPADLAAPLLEAEIAPTTSIDRRLTAWVLAGFAATCLTIGAAFWSAGAGPVMGFMGLEIVLLGGAFWLSIRDAGMREALSLAGTETIVHARRAFGRERVTRLQTYWLDVTTENAARLKLRSRDRSVEIGSFLSAGERAELADAIKEAMFKLRGGLR